MFTSRMSTCSLPQWLWPAACPNRPRALPTGRSLSCGRMANAALLATLMLVKAEALDRMGDTAGAAALRLDSVPWARYGFGPDSVVEARMRDIAAVADRGTRG